MISLALQWRRTNGVENAQLSLVPGTIKHLAMMGFVGFPKSPLGGETPRSWVQPDEI